MRSTNIIYTQITIPRLNPAFSLSLCVYVESILRIHIYEQIHLETTNKPRFPPPSSPRYTFRSAIVPDASEGFDFRSLSHLFVFPFLPRKICRFTRLEEEESGERRRSGNAPIASTLPARVSGYALSFVYLSHGNFAD